MAAVSDQLLVFAILTYTVAMLAYAVEYTLGAYGAVARIAVRQPVAAGHGTPPPCGAADDAAPTPADPAHPLPARLAGVAALTLTVLGALLQAGCLVTRGLAAHRVPWGNMYEFILAVTLVAVSVWLVLLGRRPRLRPLGLFLTLVLAVLLGVDGMLLYTPVAPLVPALNSYWLKIHVTAAVTASGVFLVGFVAAVMTLVRAGHDKGKTRFPYSLGGSLPTVDTLEQATFRIHALAFPLWTFAVICGAVWAEAAWGRYWGWDPKETWSFIAWVTYAAYLHARATPSVKRATATWIAALGWATMMVNLFGVNLFISGLHSYAGVK